MQPASLPAPLLDPIREALSSSHRHLALTLGQATRYPASVAPFASIPASDPESLLALKALLAPGESVFLAFPNAASLPAIPGLADLAVISCLQMVFPEDAPPLRCPPLAHASRRLTAHTPPPCST